MRKFLVLTVVILALSTAAIAQNFKSESAGAAVAKSANGDLTGAIAILDAAIEKGKDLSEAYQLRGSLRSFRRDFEGAIADYTAALAIDPSLAYVYERRGFFRRFLRDYDGALKDYDLAIANGFSSVTVYRGRADVKADLNDLKGAVSDLKTAHAIDPKNAGVVTSMAHYHERLGDIDSAMSTLHAFLQAYEAESKKPAKTAPVTRTGDSVMAERAGKEADGGQIFLTGVAVRSSSKIDGEAREQTLNTALAYATLGRHYKKRNDMDRALEYVARAFELDPQDHSARRLRYEIRAAKGDLKGAIEDLSTLVNLPLKAPDINADRGILFVLQGKTSDAQAEFAAYLQRFPTARPHLEKRIAEALELVDKNK